MRITNGRERSKTACCTTADKSPATVLAVSRFGGRNIEKAKGEFRRALEWGYPQAEAELKALEE